MDQLYERVLAALFLKLNQIHNVNHTERYWRILIGPWVSRFIHSMYDRWLSIEHVSKNYDINSSISLIHDEGAFIPDDLLDFERLRSDDLWNHHIFSEILKRSNLCQLIFIEGNNNWKKGTSEIKIEKSYKNKILDFYRNLISYFGKDKNYFLIYPYLSKIEYLKLNLRLKMPPFFWDTKKNTIDKQESINRKWAVEFSANNKFEKFLEEQIPYQIPRIYLEKYKELSKVSDGLMWPIDPIGIFTATGIFYDSITLSYIAKKVEDGSKLFCYQHGGHYGVAKFMAGEKHEIKISDKFFTWGWSSYSDKNVIPVGIGKINGLIKKKFNNELTLLIVGYSGSRYASGGSWEPVFDFNQYMHELFRFIHSINSLIHQNIIIRLHSWDFGLNPELRWREQFPSLRIDMGKMPIFRLFKKARLVVHTYNQTGFLETIALGVPTILIFDFKHAPIRNSAKPYYNELRRVGILFDNPIMAGIQINNIWNNIDLWWDNADLQSVVSSFRKRFCNTEVNISQKIAYHILQSS